MVKRFAAVSALVLAALTASPAARAQGFFSFYEMSPRDVLDRLGEQGYNVHLPMIRRGDVYVVDAVGPAHRPVRLIVAARDGRVMQRYATSPRWADDLPRDARWRDDEQSRAPDDFDDSRWERHTRTALGDPDAPTGRGFDGEDARLVPPAPLTDDPDKPKHHVAKKHHDAPLAKDTPDLTPKPEPSVAAVAPSEPKPVKPDFVAPSPKAIEVPQAKTPPKPEPTSQAKVEEKPAPRVIALPTSSQAKEEEKPTPVPTPKPTPTTQAKTEDKPAPKSDVAKHKKLNDLPVGTLD